MDMKKPIYTKQNKKVTGNPNEAVKRGVVEYRRNKEGIWVEVQKNSALPKSPKKSRTQKQIEQQLENVNYTRKVRSEKQQKNGQQFNRYMWDTGRTGRKG